MVGIKLFSSALRCGVLHEERVQKAPRLASAPAWKARWVHPRTAYLWRWSLLSV